MEHSVKISNEYRLKKLKNRREKPRGIGDRIFPLIRQTISGLITGLTAEDRIKVWTRSDRRGNLSWYAYDPVGDRLLEGAEESELRRWLEERYNR